MQVYHIFKEVILYLAIIAIAGCSSNSKNNEPEAGEQEKQPAEEGWSSLFNGKDLNGWEVLGGDAKFYVEDGAIVGLTEKDLPNCFLATQETFEDFVLEIDFKIDPLINSGVQIRSDTYERDTTTAYRSGKLEDGTRDWEAGRVYGYQIEIDPSERAWSGGFYEEGGRGWLIPLKDNPTAQQVFKPSEWNRFKIHAEGNSFKTWINGVEAVSATDDHHQKGFIALQLHGAWKEEQVGQKVYFKNIRIKEL